MFLAAVLEQLHTQIRTRRVYRHWRGIGTFIRVILLERNPLDHRTSKLWHDQAHSLSAHCAIDDEQCVRLHREKAWEGVIIPTGRALTNCLQHDIQDKERLVDNLFLNRTPYIRVLYKKLYYSESAEEWMRIFRFLGRESAQFDFVDREGIVFDCYYCHC